MATDALASAQASIVGRSRVTPLVRFLIAVTVFSGGFVFIEPSPYEAAFAFLCCSLLLTSVRVPALTVLPASCLALWVAGGILAVAVNGGGRDEAVYIAISAYLALTTIVFSALAAANPHTVPETIARAWIAAALVTAVLGIAGYFSLLPGAEQFALYNRARGAFKDPNVFAPFLVLPALLMLQGLLLGLRRRFLLSTLTLGILGSGVLLSFSRASWGHLVLSGLVMAALMGLTSSSNWVRIRLVAGSLLALCLLGALVSALLAVPAVYEVFELRAELTQDYDAGATGRFGTQLRSIPELLSSPFGLGPYEYANRYQQDPHNVYLNGFASYGWIGGFSYILFVATTALVGLRGVLISSPWQAFHIAVYATYAGAALEGLVVDTDHWRHYFLLAGLVWGLSAASLSYKAERGSGHAIS